MNSRVLILVQSWLVIDFFGDSRKSGEPGSSLTTTIFTQAFVGLVFATIFLPEGPETHGVAYLTANLSLSTLLLGIGVLGDPQRRKRQQADEFMVGTSPLPAGTLTLARAMHGGFYLCLVTTGMAIPPAILAYWVCGQQLLVVPAYLLLASLAAGLFAGLLAVFTHCVHLGMGPARAQLVAGSLKAFLLGGGFVGFCLCLPHLDGRAKDIPLGPNSALAWPPYWAARFLGNPREGAAFLVALLGGALLLYLAGSWLQARSRNRRPARASRPGWLAGIDRAVAREGPLLGLTAFVSTMLVRSPGYRARVLPLFGLPAAMLLLTLSGATDPRSLHLLIGMGLQFPAIFLPLIVAFLPRSDHENAAWVFHTSPPQAPILFRSASLISLTSHVLIPVHAAGLLAMLLAGLVSTLGLVFALSMSLFSLGLAVLTAELSLRRLEVVPFTRDEAAAEETRDLGGLLTLAILLALLGGGFSVLADGPWGLGLALAVVLLAGMRILAGRRNAFA